MVVEVAPWPFGPSTAFDCNARLQLACSLERTDEQPPVLAPRSNPPLTMASDVAERFSRSSLRRGKHPDACSAPATALGRRCGLIFCANTCSGGTHSVQPCSAPTTVAFCCCCRLALCPNACSDCTHFIPPRHARASGMSRFFRFPVSPWHSSAATADLDALGAAAENLHFGAIPSSDIQSVLGTRAAGRAHMPPLDRLLSAGR